MYRLQFNSQDEKNYFYLKKDNDGLTLKDAFDNADQDRDGRLVQHEFKAFYSFLIERLYTESEVTRIGEHFYMNYYKGCNEYEPSTVGVSFAEF